MPTITPAPAIPVRVTVFHLTDGSATDVQRVDAWDLLMQADYALVAPGATYADLPPLVRQCFEKHPRVALAIRAEQDGASAVSAPDSLADGQQSQNAPAGVVSISGAVSRSTTRRTREAPTPYDPRS